MRQFLMFVHWYVTDTSASVYLEGRVETLRGRSHLAYLMVSFRLSIGYPADGSALAAAEKLGTKGTASAVPSEYGTDEAFRP